MSISYVSAGTVVEHANTITPPLPGGFAAGQLAILQVVSGHPSDPTPSAPSGWALVGSFAGGGGTFASGAGPRRLTWFARVLLSSDTAPTTTIPSGGTGSVIGGFVFTLSRTGGTGWRWAATFGEDTTSGTAFSAACTPSITFTPGDFVALGWGLANSSAGPGSPAVTATGITFATVDTRPNAAHTTGFGARNALRSTSVTAGSATQAPTVTATLTAASVGVGAVLRVRQAGTDMEAFPQTVFPPRNLISTTGLLADDIVTVSLYRQVDNKLSPVRAAVDVNVTGSDVLLRVDAEQPFGVAHEYLAILTDVNGAQWSIYSSTITSTVDSDVISDAIRGIGAAVKVESPLEWQRTRDATKLNAGGRIIVVGKKRSSPSTTMTVRTVTDADGDALNQVLDDLSEGVLMFRKQNSLPRLDGYFALTDDREAPNWYDEVRWFELEVQKTEAWPSILEAAGFTLQDIADNYLTLQDIADDFTPGTLLDIALFDFGA